MSGSTTIGDKSPSDAEHLCNMTAIRIVDLLKRREISSVELVDAAMERIERVDSTINALPIRRFELARKEAQGIDRERRTAESGPGWLGGSYCRKGLQRRRRIGDHLRVTYLRRECRLALGSYRESSPTAGRRRDRQIQRSGIRGSHTFNPVFGITRNPWNVEKTAGGSSGGSAAALATGMVWLATGNDLGGSLRIPAAYCGIVGMRPSVGRVPRPISVVPYDPLWVEGPMGRCVADVALMLTRRRSTILEIRFRYPIRISPFRRPYENRLPPDA